MSWLILTNLHKLSHLFQKPELLSTVKKIKDISGQSLTQIKNWLSANETFDLGLVLEFKEAERVKGVLANIGVDSTVEKITDDE